MKPELQKYTKVTHPQLKITFLGFTKNTYPEYARSPILLALSAKESFGLTYIEAMQARCYVVGAEESHGGGVHLADQRGILTDPDDTAAAASALSKQMRRFEANDAALEDQLERNVQYANSFRPEVLVEQWIAQIKALCDQKRSG